MPAPPVWPALTFPSGTSGASYGTQTFDLSPATSPTTYSVPLGALPAGLILTSVSGDIGTISGTPSAAGSYNFTLRATNADGAVDQAFTIVIASPAPAPSSALFRIGAPTRILPRTDGTAVNGLQLAARNNLHAVKLQSPDILAADVQFTLPGALGTAGTVITDLAGDGVLSMQPGGGGSGTFGGDLATVTSTTQKVIGLNTTPIDTTVTLVDGMTLQYSVTSGKYVPVFDRATRPVSAIPGKPAAGQLVLIYTAETTEVFPVNFAAPNSYGSLGVNPSATAVYGIFKNASAVGTISISASGVFVFATTGGTTFTLNAGDRLTMVAPGSQDATLADVGITLVGTRGGVSSAVVPSPILTWRGPWTSSTAYSPFDLVSVSGTTYICTAVNTNQTPPNVTYWAIFAAAGASGGGTLSGIQQELYTAATDTGTANAYAVTLSPVPTIATYSEVVFQAAHANTTASTLTVNGTSYTLKKKGTAGSLVDLASGDIIANQILKATYDGTYFQLNLGGAGDITAKYIIGATDALLSNATVWPKLITHPDIPPTSPNTMDDEFAGTSLDPKWTTINLLSGQAITVGNGVMNFNTPGSIQSRILAVTQPVPTGNWRFRVKQFQDCATANFIGIGLCARFGTLTTGVVPMIHSSFDYANTILALHISNTTYSNEVDNYMYQGSIWYMDIGWDGTTLTWYMSASGRTFSRCYAEVLSTYLGTAPTTVGIYMHPWCNSTNGNWSGNFSTEFFRRIS